MSIGKFINTSILYLKSKTLCGEVLHSARMYFWPRSTFLWFLTKPYSANLDLDNYSRPSKWEVFKWAKRFIKFQEISQCESEQHPEKTLNHCVLSGKRLL